MRVVGGRGWVTALLVGVAASGCGVSGGGPETAADCASQIQVDGVVYTSHGFTSRAARAYGEALEAVCEDVGVNPRGSVFTDDSRTVPTYRFPGHPPDQVLGVDDGADGELGVFVADSVSRVDRDRIYEELSQSATSPGSARATR